MLLRLLRLLLRGLVSFHRLGIVKSKCDRLRGCLFDPIDSLTVHCYDRGILFVALNDYQCTLISLKMSF